MNRLLVIAHKDLDVFHDGVAVENNKTQKLPRH
jgi:hypothetical protein